jgi:hypothetical protein
MMYHWLFAIKYLNCACKIPKEVEFKTVSKSTSIELRILNWTICFLIQVAALYKVWDIKGFKNDRVDEFTSIVFIIPYLAISITCIFALCKIRKFYKSKGLGHRINKCKIIFHGSIFSVFSLILICDTAIGFLGFQNLEDNLKLLFMVSIDLGDLCLIWILYNLGTKQYGVAANC